MRRTGDGIEVVDRNVVACCRREPVVLAHCGCKLLGTLAGAGPANVAATWDVAFPGWRAKRGAQGRLAATILRAVRRADLSGVELWDTMREGSGYWRPGGSSRPSLNG